LEAAVEVEAEAIGVEAEAVDEIAASTSLVVSNTQKKKLRNDGESGSGWLY